MSRDADPSPPFFPLFSLFFYFFFPLPTSLSSPHPDLPLLLDFKSSAAPSGVLSSWDPAVDPCSGSWLGIRCRGARVTAVVLEGRGLRGPVDALARLAGLRLLSLKNNSFSSSLHDRDFSLWRPHLKLLYLSGNRFSGPFPPGFLGLRHLRRLDLAGNLFSGSIPPEIGLLLPRLLTLRLERNRLSGGIPASVGNIPGLVDLNVSDNRLTGPIPEDLAAFLLSSFAGNPGLCGDPLHRRCPKRTSAEAPAPISGTGKRKRMERVLIFTAILAAAILIMITAAVLFLIKKRPINQSKKVERRPEIRIGGGRKNTERKEEELVFFEGSRRLAVGDLMQEAAEILGRGMVGSTYRVVTECGNGEEMVVKRVRRMEGRGKEFELEESLLGEIGRWRHPNLVSLKAYHCSDEELLLVYDYLPGGSLHCLLHGNRGPGRTPLEWTARLNLASGAADALAWLHGATKLTHQHVTASNILVDREGSARVSDAALLPLVSSSFSSNSTGEAAQKSDVYSFGVVLLEILTGKPASDGEVDLPKWVRRVVREEWTSEVFDLELLQCKEIEDEMVGLLQVALLCVSPLPRDRPTMAMVGKMIEDIRDRGCRSRESHSPSQACPSFQSSSPCQSDVASTFVSC